MGVPLIQSHTVIDVVEIPKTRVSVPPFFLSQHDVPIMRNALPHFCDCSLNVAKYK